MPQNPYITFVLAGRNDNYGGDFKQRLQNCISHLYTQLEKITVPSEILFINYNPLPRPRIFEFIEWPLSNTKIAVKIINVSGNLHADFIAKKQVFPLPVLEYLAKNIGIRRSKGVFVACINPDVYLPDELFASIEKGLDEKAYYKANRLDVHLFENGDVKAYVRMNLKGHVFVLSSFSTFKNNWWKLKYAILNKYKFNSPRFKYLFDLFKITVFYHNVEFKYHCMAGGDLMLMSRKAWFTIKGYHETNSIPLHTDSLMTIQAATSGLTERILSLPILHQEHERRFSSEDNNEVQKTAYLYFQQESKEMIAKNKNKIYNNDDWGMIKFELQEIIVK